MAPSHHYTYTSARPIPVHRLIQVPVSANTLLVSSFAMAFDVVYNKQLTVCTDTAFPPIAHTRDDLLTSHDIAFLNAFAASRRLETTVYFSERIVRDWENKIIHS